MIIEFSNTKGSKNHAPLAMAIAITFCALFFIPTTLIILGYYSSKPTGTLISPLPGGVLSTNLSPTAIPGNQPIIAIDSPAASDTTTTSTDSNLTNKVAIITPNATEIIVIDPEIAVDTLIYLSPHQDDKSLYSVKSKEVGKFTIVTSKTSDVIRYVDYHLVNP